MLIFGGHRFKKAIALVASVLAGAGTAAAPLDQPNSETLTEARRIVTEMIANPRGPYSRIRWYCNDGTIKPPEPYACRAHGGGRQHAEYSPQRRRLAQLGWHVGTIYAALTFEELLESLPRQQRLRELALEQYLTDIDNGWVLRRAVAYRGRVQIEDEEKAGRALLLGVISDEDWALDNFLLVRESVRVIPHGEETDLARAVRRAAIELEQLDPTAHALRAEIHSAPGPGTVRRLRDWTQTRQREDVVRLGGQLADDLDLLYGARGRRERIDASLGKLRSPTAATWRAGVTAVLDEPPALRLHALCAALSDARASVFAALAPVGRLALIDAMQGLETEVGIAFQQLPLSQLSRSQTLQISRSLLDCAFAAGLLSATEVGAVAASLDIASRGTVALDDYRAAVRRLRRVPGWAVGTIRFTFAEPLTKYVALDARAARFADDLLRGSTMWAFGDVLRVLSRDLDQLTGTVIELNGRTVDSAAALNGGVARGRLRIFGSVEAVEAATLAATDIVVLPETIAELSPVAGILTLGEGNALSHVQLLARNFGIPNVAIDQAAADALADLAGTEVLLAVDGDNNVVLRVMDERASAALAGVTQAAPATANRIEVPDPDLGQVRVLPLDKIGRQLSGRVVGPKAANLGELNRLFPGRVAPAVALPFGVYAAHLREAGLMDRINQAFAAHGGGKLSDAELGSELAAVRKEVAALELSDKTRSELEQSMSKLFGAPGSYGVFVRSDTNVEDLPQFTGAGLNETVPNVVGLNAQFAAVPRVWSSVLSPRALAWRASVLANPARIYASVLLMKSVPATKSGVLVTSNLFDRGAPGITASTAWGVGGAVAGEAAETIVIGDDRVEPITEAKSPYRRSLDPAGGVKWLPAEAGPVLDRREIDVLRTLAVEVDEKYAAVHDENGVPRPWDIEFGFVNGELTLFQIRPLVEKKDRSAAQIVARLRPPVVGSVDQTRRLRLDRPPGDSDDR